MDHNQHDLNRWVEDRLSALRSSVDWNPDPERALVRLRDWRRKRRSGRRAWIWAFAATAASLVLLSILFQPTACAKPGGCGESFWHTVFTKPSQPVPIYQPPAEVPAPAVSNEVPPPPTAPPAEMPATHKTAVIHDFKSMGSATAPIVCEIYTDYECPHCAALYRDFVPKLMEQYIRTGKVRMVHRDFPLPQHPYAVVAARYANAAGQLGYYDAAVNQIFATQFSWSQNGDVSKQVAKVLPPDIMSKVQDLVDHDPHINDSVTADLAQGREDRLRQTPSLVVVSHGKRELLSGVPEFTVVEVYLDQLLAH